LFRCFTLAGWEAARWFSYVALICETACGYHSRGSPSGHNSGMTAMSLIESVGKFATTLDELRRKHVGAFELWLNGALDKAPGVSEREIAERIADVRKRFAEDFINDRAPGLLAVLRPESKLDIVQQLRTFAAQSDRVRHFDPTSPGNRWQPGILRPLIGAALGAATGLLLFLLEMSAPIPAQTPAAQQPATQTSPAPSAPAAEPAAASPQQDGPTPAPSQRIAPTGGQSTLEQRTLLVVSGALGAAFGAFVVLCPPFRRPTLMGGQASAMAAARRFGLAFLLLRGGLIAAAISAVVSATIGLAGLLLTGPKPWWTILLGLAAVFLIVLFRWVFPNNEKGDRREAACRTATAALDRELKIDAELWATLAAGLALRPASAALPDPKIDHVRSIILARRDRSEPGEDILRIVEQELGLPAGPGQGSQATSPTVFAWESRHTDLYEPFGVVKVGDMVEVKVPPQMTTDAGGIARVFQKGTVARKR